MNDASKAPSDAEATTFASASRVASGSAVHPSAGERGLCEHAPAQLVGGERVVDAHHDDALLGGDPLAGRQVGPGGEDVCRLDPRQGLALDERGGR